MAIVPNGVIAMSVQLLNVPREWKQPKRRASCKHCGTALWTKDGSMPVDHDRPDGRACRAAAKSYVREHHTGAKFYR